MKYFLVIAAFVVGTALLMWAAAAQAMGMCATYKEMVQGLLGTQYGESSIGKGLAAKETIVIELFVGKETFTILATSPDSGRACILAAGKMWIGVAPKINGDDL